VGNNEEEQCRGAKVVIKEGKRRNKEKEEIKKDGRRKKTGSWRG